jgi:Uma2 family endonuclease
MLLSDTPRDTSIVQPHVVYVATADLGRVSARAIEGAPTLAIEILSPSTAELDRGRKRRLYARHGVPYYWIVDGDARTVEMYRLEGDAHVLLARGTGDAIVAAAPFPGLALTGIWP